MILILSHADDFEATEVQRRLAGAGLDVAAIDTFDFPARLGLSAEIGVGTDGWSASLDLEGERVRFGEVTAVWYRRPRAFDLTSELTPLERSFVLDESRLAFGGLLSTLHRALWVPARLDVLAAADRKPLQLEIARHLGLDVPATLLTNDPAQASEFFQRHGQNIIFKTLSGGVQTESGHRLGVFTTPVTLDDLERWSCGTRYPCLFQENVPKAAELRVTVIGDQVFAVEVSWDNLPSELSSGRAAAAKHDWRVVAGEAHYAPYDLPHKTGMRLLELMRWFGVRFAAVDMIVTPDGRHVFLELNPNGQWGWIEERLELGMLDAMADLLAHATVNQEVTNA